MRGALTSCVASCFVVSAALVFASASCGEPRKEANAAVRPPGSGWYCWRNQRIPNASRCLRAMEECASSREGAKSANGKSDTSLETFTECQEEPRAGCFTSVRAKNGVESFTCAASVNDCESQRRNIERDPETSGNYASISRCTPWD